MLRRFLLPTAVLAGILLLGLAHLVANGRHAREVVAENLPHRPLSSGTRDLDLWHPTASFGHVYNDGYRPPNDPYFAHLVKTDFLWSLALKPAAAPDEKR